MALYLSLDVLSTVSREDIRYAFHTFLKAWNLKSFANKSNAEFEKASLAYSVLYYYSTRNIYDKTGKHEEKIIDPLGSIQKALFYVGMRAPGDNKNENIISYKNVTLEEIFNKANLVVKTIRTSLCSTCSGSGVSGDPKKYEKCGFCIGSECSRCNYSGMSEWTTMFCGDCNGCGIKGPRVDYISVSVPAGCDARHPLIVENAGDIIERKEEKRGRVTVYLNELRHPTFVRGKNPGDLIMNVELSFLDILHGFSIKKTLIDGTTCKIGTKTPFSLACEKGTKMVGDGMHIFNEGKRGNVIVNFTINGSNKLSISEKEKLNETAKEVEI